MDVTRRIRWNFACRLYHAATPIFPWSMQRWVY